MKCCVLEILSFYLSHDTKFFCTALKHDYYFEMLYMNSQYLFRTAHIDGKRMLYYFKQKPHEIRSSYEIILTDVLCSFTYVWRNDGYMKKIIDHYE